MNGNEHLIPRSYRSNTKMAVRGEGIYLYDEEGQEYIDGCCGALLSSIGHGNKEIADAMYHQLSTMEFAHPSRWSNRPAIEAAEELTSITSEGLDHVWFVSGGSEAIESAMKMARQYFVERDGEGSAKSLFIGRWNSFHGGTLGAMGLAGNMERRRTFSPIFKEGPKIEAHYCYRCPYALEYPSCKMKCATELEDTIQRLGPQYVAAFFAEPIVGSSVGALVPPDEYWQVIRDICDRYDVLLVADEIMTGMGRTGKAFCLQHWDVVPDIMCTAKAMAGGYAPVGAMIVKDSVIESIKKGSGAYHHGHTFNANPVSASAVAATIRYMKKHNLFENAAKQGEHLRKRLEALGDIDIIGDIRGKGLMWGIELVANKKTKEPFEASRKAAGVLTGECTKERLIVYPGTGQINGLAGDQVIVAPPLIVTEEQIDDIAERFGRALKATSVALGKTAA